MRKLNFISSFVQRKIASEPSPFIDDTHFRSRNKQVSPSRETLIICRTVRGNHEPSIAVIRPSDLLSAKTNYLYVSPRFFSGPTCPGTTSGLIRGSKRSLVFLKGVEIRWISIKRKIRKTNLLPINTIKRE